MVSVSFIGRITAASCMSTLSTWYLIYFSIITGNNYVKYLTYYPVFLANLEIYYPGVSELLQLGTFSVGRSLVTSGRTDVDKMMEETFLCRANSRVSSRSGVTDLLTNFNVYQRWVRTTHLRSQYINVATQLQRDTYTRTHIYMHLHWKP